MEENKNQFEVHSHGVLATASKNNLIIEVHVAVEVTDASVHVNRSICCYHKTLSLRQRKNRRCAHRVNEPLICNQVEGQ